MSAPSFNSRALRDALSTFATGVTIVTTSATDGTPVGMTASSFNSVSMDPPLILWSVTKTALSAENFRRAPHFSVHVLSSDQVELCNGFARRGVDKFSDVDFSTDENNVPIIAGAVSRFDCSHWAAYEGGDHWIIVGKVENIVRANSEALIFCGGSYATASPMRSAHLKNDVRPDDESPVDGLLIYNLSRAYRQIADQFHRAVRESGLTVSEWRILASLHGNSSRAFSDLAARTFVDPEALRDMVKSMEEAGLCKTEGHADAPTVSGTPTGHDRVQHLFAMSAKQEDRAVGNHDDLQRLMKLLKTVIANTNE